MIAGWEDVDATSQQSEKVDAVSQQLQPKGYPTIGLILCSDTSEDMARYSILHDNNRLFQTKYLTYLPSEAELKHEIEQQKEIFRLQQAEARTESE